MNSLIVENIQKNLGQTNLPAINYKNQKISYGELNYLIHEIFSHIKKDKIKRVGIFSNRAPIAYAGILANYLQQKCSVPLNPSFPAERLQYIIDETKLDLIIVDENYWSEWCGLKLNSQKTIKLNGQDLKKELPVQISTPTEFDPDAEAYILFTSGSTGTPKGIPIHRHALETYVENAQKFYPISTNDRVSQTFDLSFDLSMHDIFSNFCGGGELYPLEQTDLLFTAAFINRHQLTHWFSVPTLVNNMIKMRTVKPGVFPTLKYSMFCGEALGISTVTEWKKAAANSCTLNIYGPTEATIAFTIYEVNEPILGEREFVSIGKAFNNLKTKIDENGELLLSGEQLAKGYFQDVDKTKNAFIESNNERWYRTGDLCKEDSAGNLFYLGRLDQQVKINGLRIELTEIEAVLKNILLNEMIVTLNVNQKLVVAFEDTLPNLQRLKEELQKKLPTYMIPQNFFVIGKFPTNSNGKIDRKKITETLALKLA